MVLKPSERGVALIAVFCTAAALSTCVSALRVYVRCKIIKRRVNVEDLTAAMGWLLFLGLCGIASAGTFYGTATHIQLIPPQDLVMAFKITWFYDMLYVWVNAMIKQSISLQLLRYAVEDYQKMVINVVTYALHIYSTILFFMVLFQCIPHSFFWTQVLGDTNGRCTDKFAALRVSYGYTSLIIIYDVTMALLPWLMVRKLQLDLRTRLMVTAVLAMGSIASIAVIVRMPFVVRLSKTQDLLYDHALIAIISCAEIALSYIASSAATLRPLFRRTLSPTSSERSARHPAVANIEPGTGSSSTASTTKESELEFATAFYGTKA